MSVCCERRVLSGRRVCVGLITRPEESYRLWCVVVCDLETSYMRRAWPNLGGGVVAQKQKSRHTKQCSSSRPMEFNADLSNIGIQSGC